ncbi:transposase [Streptomyces sp. ISL-1]|uniref:transposase n=1 Tax=Streptomyces sp. ISL-1 TaxID=2817657 RepID=UPI0035AB8B9D
MSWSHPGRFRSEAAFAAFAGTPPIPASSGLTNRHRLNRRGDRQLNRALHTIVLIRMRIRSTSSGAPPRASRLGRPGAA